MMRFILSMAVLSTGCAIAAEGDLAIDRIEPPSWWTAAGPQQISLLIEGAGLNEATVAIDGGPSWIGKIDHAQSGRALMALVTVRGGAEPGRYHVVVTARAQSLRVPWTLVAAPTRKPDPFGPDDVIYLIMPDRFADGELSNNELAGGDHMLDRKSADAYHGGDFEGIRQRLRYLKDLGVTAIWLTPIYRPDPHWLVFPTGGPAQPNLARAMRRMAEYHGYAPVDYYATNPRFGSLEQYQKLVEEIHRLRLKIIQDHIVGFTGPRHHWVKAPPFDHWFHGSVANPPKCTFRFDTLVNPHADDAERRGVTDGWFVGILPDLNTQDARVRRYAIQQSLWWAVRGEADGIRLDTYPLVERTFWREWSREREAARPGLSVVGEAWLTDPAQLSFFQGGRAGWDEIDPGVGWVFDFPLNLAIVEVFAGRLPASRLARMLARDGLYHRSDRLVTFLDNHDTVRLAGMPGVTPARYRVAIAFLLTARGIPQMTWGDELGIPGHMDDRRDFPGGFPGDARNAFEAAGRTPEEQRTFETWKTLLALRRSSPALRRGRMTDLSATDTTYAYLREMGDERLVVVFNLAGGPATVRIPAERVHGAQRAEVVYGSVDARIHDRTITVEIPGESAAVLRVFPERSKDRTDSSIEDRGGDHAGGPSSPPSSNE
jgi:glycosidase